MTFRIFSSIIIVVSILYLPFWLSAVLLIAGNFYFKNFYECIIGAMLLDLLYGLPMHRFFNIPFFFTSVMLVLFILTTFLKTKLTWYANK